MFLTSLTGVVVPEEWDVLKANFRKASEQLPSAIHQSFLLQDNDNANVWSILTVWKSLETLAEYRESVDTPEGILIFRSVGTEPILAKYDVAAYTRAD